MTEIDETKIYRIKLRGRGISYCPYYSHIKSYNFGQRSDHKAKTHGHDGIKIIFIFTRFLNPIKISPEFQLHAAHINIYKKSKDNIFCTVSKFHIPLFYIYIYIYEINHIIYYYLPCSNKVLI